MHEHGCDVPVPALEPGYGLDARKCVTAPRKIRKSMSIRDLCKQTSKSNKAKLTRHFYVIKLELRIRYSLQHKKQLVPRS